MSAWLEREMMGTGAVARIAMISAFLLVMLTVTADANSDSNDASFPTSDITLVVPYGEGGPTDILFRAIAERAQAYLNTAIITVNMPGNGATLGSQFVKQSPADGYTLLGSHQTIDLANIAGLSDYSHEAFAPVALLTRTVNIPTTSAGHSLTQASDLVALAQQQPGDLHIGIIANSTDHFFWLHFFEQSGIAATDIQFVNYPDTISQIVALIGGELDVAMLNLPSAESLFSSGALVPLGVASETRLAALPEVPTLIEQGIEMTNTTNRGLFAPLNTPPERLERLASAFEHALKQPELMDLIQYTYGSSVEFLPLEAYSRYLDTQYDQLQKLANSMAFER